MKTSAHSICRSTARHASGHGAFLRHSALAVAVALAAAGMTVVANTGPGLPDASPLAIEQSGVQIPPSFAALIESVQPAVVNVAVAGKGVSMSGDDMPDLRLPDDPRFKDFFERFFHHSPPLPDSAPEGRGSVPGVQGVGSGFIVSTEGHVVTSHHVVEGASEIHVVLNDGRRLEAKVRGVDPKTDLALLKIEAENNLPYVVFGDSEGARTGDWVVAIGNPFGLGGTATTGIISARGRDIQSGPYDDYLQIDAPINRGNSGGPLFDLTGRVVGVNTAIYSPNGGSVGIGFAVPAAQARSVIEQLMTNGHVERGWLGVRIQVLTDALARSMQLPDTRGALVASVTPESPAARAGIEVGDVILAFGGQEVTEMRDLPRLVADLAPGRKAAVTVWREGKKLDLEASVARSPETMAEANETSPEAADGPRLGLALAPITEELRQRFDVARDLDGALVVEVEAGSPAARQGLRPGDVIVRAGGRQVSTPDDVIGAVSESQADDGNTVVLLVNRKGDQHFVAVRLG